MCMYVYIYIYIYWGGARGGCSMLSPPPRHDTAAFAVLSKANYLSRI